MIYRVRLAVRAFLVVGLSAGLLQLTSSAQSRLQTMPGYEQFRRMGAESRDAVKSGALSVTWKDPKTFEYARDGKLYRYDLATKTATEVGVAPEPAGRGRGRGERSVRHRAAARRHAEHDRHAGDADVRRRREGAARRVVVPGDDAHPGHGRHGDRARRRREVGGAGRLQALAEAESDVAEREGGAAEPEVDGVRRPGSERRGEAAPRRTRGRAPGRPSTAR